MLDELLAEPGVEERCALRSPFGLMALHGGSLEWPTHRIAEAAAERAGASSYAVVQPWGFRWHVPSLAFDPSGSSRLRRFLDHVDVVVSLHGYGADSLVRDGADGDEAGSRRVLLGGRNRDLARSLGAALRSRLRGFDVVDDLEAIPRRMRGLHRRNPVNVPRGAGVQVEIPPGLRGLGPRFRGCDPEARLRAAEPLIQALVAVAGDRAVPGGPGRR